MTRENMCLVTVKTHTMQHVRAKIRQLTMHGGVNVRLMKSSSSIFIRNSPTISHKVCSELLTF